MKRYQLVVHELEDVTLSKQVSWRGELLGCLEITASGPLSFEELLRELPDRLPCFGPLPAAFS